MVVEIWFSTKYALKKPISRLLNVQLPTHFVKMGHIIYIEPWFLLVTYWCNLVKYLAGPMDVYILPLHYLTNG